VKSDDLEIARFLHLKAKIRKFKLEWSVLRSEILDFGFEMQESCDFEIVRFHNSLSDNIYRPAESRWMASSVA
jgi:hypothetical protein